MDFHLTDAVNWLTLVVKLLPVVLQMVQQVEQAVVGPQKGEQKKAVIMQTVNAVAESAGVRATDLPKVNLAIGKVIDAQVSALNGVLNKNVVVPERRATP